jgi:hypothetical protein
MNVFRVIFNLILIALAVASLVLFLFYAPSMGWVLPLAILFTVYVVALLLKGAAGQTQSPICHIWDGVKPGNETGAKESQTKVGKRGDVTGAKRCPGAR